MCLSSWWVAEAADGEKAWAGGIPDIKGDGWLKVFEFLRFSLSL